MPRGPQQEQMLTERIVDHTRESLAIDAARELNSEDVWERLGWLFVHQGIAERILSDNGPESSGAVRTGSAGSALGYCYRSALCVGKRYVENFNGKLR